MIHGLEFETHISKNTGDSLIKGFEVVPSWNTYVYVRVIGIKKGN